MRQGVIYIATGEKHVAEALVSARSLKRHMPDLPVTLYTDQAVVAPDMDVVGFAADGYLSRIPALVGTPYERTLFLDSDTYVCGDLGGLFALLDEFDIALAHSPTRAIYEVEGVPDSFPEFNAGVILYRRSARVKAALRDWAERFARFQEQRDRGEIRWLRPEGKRIYAHESIYEELCAALVAEAKKAKIGNGLDPDTVLGPLQNQMQYDKVVGLIADTKKAGGRFLTGGDVPAGPGYFLPPALVTDIDESSRLVREEQFGPIVPILKFTDVEDAIRRANDTRFGLSGSVWTKDVERGAAIAARLEVGTAWVNQHRATSAFVPFGGAKESGLGRQYASLGLKSYMEPEVVSVAK